MCDYKHAFRSFFGIYVRSIRGAHKLTQEDMSVHLRITPRALIDLERQKYAPSALTVLFLLSFLPSEEALRLIEIFRRRMAEVDETEEPS